MAQGKYSRVDGRRSSSGYCSTAAIVVFVALCLVGVWVFSSFSVSPPESPKSPAQKQKNDFKEEIRKVGESGGKQFEDNPGDLPEDVTKGDNNDSTSEEDKTNDIVSVEKREEETSDGNKIDNENEEKKREEIVSKVEATSEDTKTNDGEKTSESGDIEQKTEENSSETKEEEKVQIEEKVESDEKDSNTKEQAPTDVFPSGAQSELLNETTTQTGSFSTQAAESKHEQETQKSEQQRGYSWKLCSTTAGSDFIPCLDNLYAIKHLKTTKHYEHRERHCPDEPPTCLVPLPEGYRQPIEWPKSREKIWYYNVPHTKLAEVKGHQNWVKITGEYLTFPGGGTQFKHGALHYIEFIENMLQKQGIDFSWGKSTRVVLDVGCGVASFGGYLFDKDVVTMSLAPKDEHEAQVQFALERGIPAISAVMGTKRLPFPGIAFDVVHCARCRVPWHIEGGKLLLELNRLLRPGGYFVWSATPVYQDLPEDVQIWEAMSKLLKSMCWELIAKEKDKINEVGAAVYRKPISNDCYEHRSDSDPPMCQKSDDHNAAWNVPLQSCMHSIPVGDLERGSHWPERWPARVEKVPYWMTSSQVGVYGKPAPEDFSSDYEHWKRVVNQSYLKGMGFSWSNVRNVMDMRAIYGGFAAALRELNIWVMNVVSIDSADTLPIIYERGLFGMYHDWCESFSTYPRSYDLLHADHLFSKIKNKCSFMGLVAEADRILRPEGKLIVRDKVEIVTELESLLRAMKWEIRMTYSKDKEGLLCAQKTMWRPTDTETLAYAKA
ncbi:putative methyltransferase PMT26 [Drosera capensis]